MDDRTLKALEFGKVLDHLARLCLSEAGREACLGLVPLHTPQAVHTAQQLVDEYRTWAHEGVFKPVAFPDISALFAYLQQRASPLDLDALWALREVLNLARRAVQSLRDPLAAVGSTAVALSAEQAQERYPALCELVSHPMPEMTIAALNRCVADDGLLRDESSPELLLVRSELRRLHQGCLRQVKDFSARYNIGHYLQDEYMTLASDRYVLPIKSNFKGRLQGIIHDYSQTGETCYFEPMFLVEHNNRLQELKRQEREEEQNVLRYLSQIVRDESASVRAAWDVLIELDVLRAKNGLADAYDGVRVTVDTNTPLCLMQACHPLLAIELPRQGKGRAQPLDLLLREGEHALIISGGNAGGKTVCLKTLGLITAMTLTGIPVPVQRGSTLPWWPQMHAFIGDEQSLDDHVSTFTAQIHHVNQAWQQADSHSLILLDEFGAGTDPAQGAALAQAVLDELLERGACIVAATHFPALKTYALTRQGVRAASVLFDPGTKLPLFRLAYDQVGASQALDVAREHGLPESILRRAEQYLLVEGQDSGSIMERLNALGAQREQELDTLKAEQIRTRDKRLRLQERFEQERARLESEVRQLSQTIMREWQAGRVTHKQALKELSRVRAEATAATVAEAAAQAAPSVDTLRVGQRVTHRPWNRQAVICELDERQNRVKLDMNGVTMWADMSLIAPLEGGNAAPAATSRASGRAVLVRTGASADQESSLLRLDLRGKRADLAEVELTRFLDAALLAGHDVVEIVHGKGTGALRKQVHAQLKLFPGIASYCLAPEDRGGDGMTMVTFQ